MATKLNSAWQKLFDKYNIEEEISKNGYYIITADQIREFREPRLMTKFDHDENLPELFKQNKYSILPISRSEYYISHNNIFFELKEENYKVESFPLPNYIESISSDSITSEAIALNCSYLTGMIEDFVEDKDIVPTVSGKMSSKKFSYSIENTLTKNMDIVNVQNSMIEIDGAYEGQKYLTIIEAKQTMCDNFLIRQLYYPYRVWEDKVSKDIRLIYFVYTNNIFHFFEYKFKDKNNYNSLELIKQKNYTLEDYVINTQDICDLLESVKVKDEPKIPFPQADSFNRIINMCEYLFNQDKDKKEITLNYAFDKRQTDYYVNAGKYLGLLENKRSIVTITDLSKSIMKMNYRAKQLKFVELILKHKVFKEALSLRLETGEVLNKKQVIMMMQQNNLYKVESDETYRRRASTIISWIEWIIGLIQE